MFPSLSAPPAIEVQPFDFFSGPRGTKARALRLQLSAFSFPLFRRSTAMAAARTRKSTLVQSVVAQLTVEHAKTVSYRRSPLRSSSGLLIPTRCCSCRPSSGALLHQSCEGARADSMCSRRYVVYYQALRVVRHVTARGITASVSGLYLALVKVRSGSIGSFALPALS